jgi:NAD(P)-dependent dehydrogenase (short-subunit alcohol dehydrogenase family)
MGELDGRIALVTGASRGIGAATARALAEAGARVIATDLVPPDALAAEIGGHACRQDVTDEEDWIATMRLARGTAGGLDILVNNAGLLLMKPVTEIGLDEWRRLHAVNVEGVFLGAKHAVPLLVERAGRWKGGTTIINLSSVAGITGSPGFSCYNASKGAVRLFSKGLALELAPLGIRVNSVHPGVIDTNMGAAVVQGFAAARAVGTNEAQAQVAGLHPLGHLGSPSDVGDAVVFLASSRAAFITGAELVVDGGFTAQ